MKKKNKKNALQPETEKDELAYASDELAYGDASSQSQDDGEPQADDGYYDSYYDDERGDDPTCEFEKEYI